ncbi:MAG: response regulator transcription factor [Actinomycetota bacterium]|nr:response regulator transcription factor [Actinomycetota bacterium]
MAHSVVGNGAKRLGLVWIHCPYPVLARGLIGTFAAEADVHHGEKPPESGVPACVLVCSDNEDETEWMVREARSLASESPVLVFGLSSDLPLVRAALRAGARGFVHACMEPSQIVRALSVATQGEVVIPRDLLNDLVADEAPIDLGGLTPRQREVLGLVVEGMTNAQIARELYLSESTIKQHLRGAFKALKVKNRTEAARLLGERV